jgi:hypothetical protein
MAYALAKAVDQAISTVNRSIRAIFRPSAAVARQGAAAS